MHWRQQRGPQGKPQNKAIQSVALMIRTGELEWDVVVGASFSLSSLPLRPRFFSFFETPSGNHLTADGHGTCGSGSASCSGVHK
jgi:hypothetical protein